MLKKLIFQVDYQKINQIEQEILFSLISDKLIEIGKIQKSFALPWSMIAKLVSNELQISRLVCRDLSAPPESMFEVQKLLGGPLQTKIGHRNEQNQIPKCRDPSP